MYKKDFDSLCGEKIKNWLSVEGRLKTIEDEYNDCYEDDDKCGDLLVFASNERCPDIIYKEENNCYVVSILTPSFSHYKDVGKIVKNIFYNDYLKNTVSSDWFISIYPHNNILCFTEEQVIELLSMVETLPHHEVKFEEDDEKYKAYRALTLLTEIKKLFE